jgi:hypothetical protein
MAAPTRRDPGWDEERTMRTKDVAGTRSDGVLVWRRSADRGGALWTERLPGQARPADRTLWSARRRDVARGDATAAAVAHDASR